MRRALLIWGWGHLALGDWRGWLLVLLEPLAIGGLLLAAWQLIDGTSWLTVFVPLMALLVVWVGQAVHAHRRAIAVGRAPGGELALAWVLPVAMAVVSAFWLIGGRHGSPAATVEAYMDAWRAGQPNAATGLFADAGIDAAALDAFWHDQSSELAARLSEGRATFGAESGLDPARPFNSLRVTQLEPSDAGEVFFTVEIVRSERFETTLLGVVRTAAQRTVVVQQLVQLTLREEHVVGGWLPSSSWRVLGVWDEGGIHLP